MPKKERFEAQPPIEILRQWLDYEGWYDIREKEKPFMQISNLILTGAMGPPGGGRSQLTNRFMRHFNVITYTELVDSSIKSIFTKKVNNFLVKFSPEAKSVVNTLVDSTLSLYKMIKSKLLPMPKSSHYLFNLRDMSKVLQGVCSVDDYTLITAYDGNDKENSIVYILNNEREIVSTVTLYNRAHVGGIAYDDVHDIIWITDYVGTISGYNKDDILNGTYAVPKFKRVFVSDNMLNFWGKQSIAYITYHNNKIYLGNFAFKELSMLRSYEILDDGMIDLDSEFTQSFGDFTQGISFADKNDQCFLLDSSSFGKTKSCLRITPFDEESNTVISDDYIELDTPPRIEQINYTDDGDLDVVFEVNAELYNSDQVFIYPDYSTLDFDDMLDYSCKRF